MDGGPFSAVIAERKEVGCDEVAPETHSKPEPCPVASDSPTSRLCVLLVQRVFSLRYDPCELCLLARVYLEPVDPLLGVGTPSPSSRVLFIVGTLESTDAKRRSAESVQETKAGHPDQRV